LNSDIARLINEAHGGFSDADLRLAPARHVDPNEDNVDERSRARR
jgi:hypothetical protein